MNLTKRPERRRKLLTDPTFRGRVAAKAAWHINGMRGERPLAATVALARWNSGNAPANIQEGVSVENQEQAEARIPELVATPATVRFLSCEPLLGPVDVSPWCDFGEPLGPRAAGDGQSAIDLVIIGGESGPGARPCNIEWIRDLLEQCQAAGVAPFVKQFGSKPLHTPIIHGFGTDCGPIPLKLRSSHGTDMAEWPEWARAREFPEVGR